MPIIITGLFVTMIPQHCLLKAGAVKKSYGPQRGRYTASCALHDKWGAWPTLIYGYLKLSVGDDKG